MTTEPTATPEVPAWLNLDEFVSPGAEGRLAKYVARMKAKLAEMMSDAFDAADSTAVTARQSKARTCPTSTLELSSGPASGTSRISGLDAPLLDLDNGYPSDETIEALQPQVLKVHGRGKVAGIDDEVQIVTYEAMKAAQS